MDSVCKKWDAYTKTALKAKSRLQKSVLHPAKGEKKKIGGNFVTNFLPPP